MSPARPAVARIVISTKLRWRTAGAAMAQNRIQEIENHGKN
jgi:hypothetical protein